MFQVGLDVHESFEAFEFTGDEKDDVSLPAKRASRSPSPVKTKSSNRSKSKSPTQLNGKSKMKEKTGAKKPARIEPETSDSDDQSDGFLGNTDKELDTEDDVIECEATFPGQPYRFDKAKALSRLNQLESDSDDDPESKPRRSLNKKESVSKRKIPASTSSMSGFGSESVRPKSRKQPKPAYNDEEESMVQLDFSRFSTTLRLLLCS